MPSHRSVVSYRRQHGGKLAWCHRQSKQAIVDFLKREPRVLSMHSTNFVCHGGAAEPRMLLDLSALLTLLGCLQMIRFPNVRMVNTHMDENGNRSKATVMFFANGKAVTNGVSAASRIFLLFIEGFYWLTTSMRYYNKSDYDDLFYTRFVAVNNPHTGVYRDEFNLPKMLEQNSLQMRNTSKFKGFATAFGRANTSVFKTKKFIVTGARDSEEAVETVESAIDLYSAYIIPT
jgi:hypothetical protein